MLLPKLPYSQDKVKRMVTKFLGLNLTENTQEGQFSDTLGLSSEKYPVLTQRKGRYKQTTYSNVADLFEWDGKRVVVAGGLLYFDGVAIENVTNTKKQFAVVNTHLIVMPDAIDIDMSSEYYDDQNIRHFIYKKLNGSTKTAATTNATTFANGKDITANLDPKIDSFMTWMLNYVGFGEGTFYGPCLYTYGTNKTAVKNCYQNGAWNMTALAAIENLSSPFGVLPGSTADFQYGMITIPRGSGNSLDILEANNNGTTTNRPNKNLYNTQGYYCVFVSAQQYYYSVTDHGVLRNCTFDVYRAGVDAKLFSLTFDVGDYVSLADSGDSNYNFTHAKVTAISDSPNKITVNTYDENAGTWTGTPFSTTSKNFSNAMTITKDYPQLDYICERGNRLWGLSNRDKTIYASQLGLPGKIYVEPGESDGTDDAAYAVAVGSEGDFTAICSYGDATCCWKENGVHKVLGDYPSNFYINEYKIAGVQKNSEKSLCVINETLFYKGVNGVFTYTGSTPSLISGALGRDDFNTAVGGTDGERYYISMKDRQAAPYLFTYDLVNGIWLKEDNIYADAFTKISGVTMGPLIEDQFYMASGGYVYKMGQDNDEKFDWIAEFCPFYTSVRSSSSYARTIGKMGYSKIILQLDMESGSRVQVWVKEDKKPYRLAWTQSATNDYVVSIPIRIGRCDQYQVKLTGHGRTTIRAMQRVYKVGSEV